MVFMADEYQNYPGNNHTLYKEGPRRRSAAPLAPMTAWSWRKASNKKTEPMSVRIRRGSLASHVVGYYSQQYGLSGIEQSMNDTPKGQENFASWLTW